jgi:hypothetical protein
LRTHIDKLQKRNRIGDPLAIHAKHMV